MLKKRETLFDFVLIAVGFSLLIYTCFKYGIKIDMKLFAILLIAMVTLDNLGIKYTDIKLSISPVITIASFLIYGAESSALLATASTMIETIFFRKKVKNGFLNGAMFSITYIVAGHLYEILGGKIGRFSVGQLIYVVIYVLTSFVINYFILYYALKAQGKILFKKYWTESSVLELVSYFVMVPVGIFLANMYMKFGTVIFIYHVIPLILLSFFIKAFRDLYKANQRLNALYEMVKIINSKLDLDKTLEAILYETEKVVTVSGIAIYLKDDNGFLINEKTKCREESLEAFKDVYMNNEGLIGKVVNEGKSVIIGNLKADKGYFDKNISKYYDSAIVVPIKGAEGVMGCISAFQNEINAFDEDSLKIMEALSEQSSIAIMNAKRYFEISKKSITDPLTKTYNRRFFDQILHDSIAKSSIEKTPVSLIMLDVDRFKQINDTYGHMVGDTVLREIASRIKSCVRNNDIVARYGGEEFSVILPNLTAEQACVIAERIRYEVSSKPIKTDAGDINITVSAGVADFPNKAESAEKLISHADRALYAGCKTKGRDRVAVYEI
ncbi:MULTISPECIES: sensor domain-containing diguanylate cyclase [Thermoanaerobacterium]|uniref:GAF sensor-containing diguanylate cyclase n=2 Tax=Thermoanaerobacterium TaxID=28895 RepID=W9E9S0_9THEO|nr:MULTISPECIES: sensor domain-containing diguanylate cyclase [Thermoanaerobacterium]AFK85983.1 diguanylate cyclase with GAF sensor [Thermoanaerobacterium saccharolyticum JW/SL-YS485]ETO38677.1 GAF sensor-containing diguanylate cyclase [Thermoanaerobacterium aotearoense SCUT27]